MTGSDARGSAAPPPSPSVQFHRIARTGTRDLQFEGRLIGQGTNPAEFPNRSLHVAIYATTSGKYVTRIDQGPVGLPGPDAPPGSGMEAVIRADVHETAEEAYEWLLSANRGRLGRVSKEAWVQACQNWPPLAGQDVETV
jgi:hypothetical protein